MTPEVREASQTLVDALAPTPKDAADTFKRYADLKDARYLLPDGEILTAAQYRKECDDAANWLRDVWLPEHKEIEVEGIGRLRLIDKTTTEYDLKAMAEHDRPLFETLNDLACLKVNSAAAKPHLAGRLAMLKKWAIPLSTPSLSPIERPR